MPNIIRIRNLVQETSLSGVTFPIDKQSYTEYAKRIDIFDLKEYILSGFTGNNTGGTSGTSGHDGIDGVGVDGTSGTSGISPCTVLESNHITITIVASTTTTTTLSTTTTTTTIIATTTTTTHLVTSTTTLSPTTTTTTTPVPTTTTTTTERPTYTDTYSSTSRLDIPTACSDTVGTPIHYYDFPLITGSTVLYASNDGGGHLSSPIVGDGAGHYYKFSGATGFAIEIAVNGVLLSKVSC